MILFITGHSEMSKPEILVKRVGQFGMRLTGKGTIRFQPDKPLPTAPGAKTGQSQDRRRSPVLPQAADAKPGSLPQGRHRVGEGQDRPGRPHRLLGMVQERRDKTAVGPFRQRPAGWRVDHLRQAGPEIQGDPDQPQATKSLKTGVEPVVPAMATPRTPVNHAPCRAQVPSGPEHTRWVW
jgi:hypothetical protein